MFNTCRKIIVSFMIVLSVPGFRAQDGSNDSLIKIYNNSALADTVRLKALHRLSWSNIYTHPDTALKYAIVLINESRRVKNEFWEADGLNISGIYYDVTGDYQKALNSYLAAIEIFKRSDDKKHLASVYGNVGTIYANLSNYPKALDYNFMALKLYEEAGNLRGQASSFISIGRIYTADGDLEKALGYELKSLNIGEKIGDRYIQGTALGNIGIIYRAKKDNGRALDCYLKALAIDEQLQNKYGQLRHIGNIGEIYFSQDSLEKSLAYSKRALEISEEIKDKRNQITYLDQIGVIYNRMKNYELAGQYLQKSLALAEEVKSLDQMKEIYQNLSGLYEETGKPTEALRYFKKYSDYKDSVFNAENVKKQAHAEMQYEFDKKQAMEKAEQEKKDERQKLILLFVCGFLLLVMVFSVATFRNLRINKKQKRVIEEKQKDITDSINYAQKIQTCILPSDDEFKTAFPESFILYKPKDIVSGDFYWLNLHPGEFPQVDERNGNWKVIHPLVAAADCTGHGVPGSLMSMLGNSLLNKIVNTDKLYTPSFILDSLRTEIINALKQSSDSANKDGMDISLCVFYEDHVEYAGANNPLYIVRAKGNFEKIKGDKMPIGYTSGEQKPFTNHTIKIEKGDCFYIFSDGYADQFGGPDGKKFKYKKLEDLLVSIHKLPLSEQKHILGKTIEEWKGANDQTDDILIIGIRI